ncbi:MAG TPA: antitoxin Xre/MbcA/ParS toxin-binding domain-containing protein [Terriglobales bacterium]|jgi:putative toxin-antitoxin system antitoxin component (TIGR02293 family)|nr:antitoxin Xre/MbcA/ParS toxin-binding domain-containing protein [Terriglobales bacterium]
MSVLHQQIGQWLGVPVPKTEQQMLEIVEHQLPTSAINRIVALGITRAEIDGLVIPLRTLQHRRSRREKLTVEESDRVFRVARLLSQAESVYGSRERALAWLRRTHPRLRNRTPLEMAKTDTGSRIVEELLVQIDEGMFV